MQKSFNIPLLPVFFFFLHPHMFNFVPFRNTKLDFSQYKTQTEREFWQKKSFFFMGSQKLCHVPTTGFKANFNTHSCLI